MPSTATITAFYNFTANTKARASQVNNNFDVIRGHFIPIHVIAATSADNTYDLGSSEYKWRNGYFQSLTVSNPIFPMTTTANLSTLNLTSLIIMLHLVWLYYRLLLEQLPRVKPFSGTKY